MIEAMIPRALKNFYAGTSKSMLPLFKIAKFLGIKVSAFFIE